VSRIDHMSEVAQRRIMRERADRSALHPHRQFGEVPLNEIGEELGVSRERARQLEARALRRLCSIEHRAEVRKRLDEAIVEWRAAKKSGVEMRMLWAIHNVNALIDALDWLDAYHDGTLAEHFAHASQKGEATIYTSGFSATQWAGMQVSTWGERRRAV
jgi:hypothetical protein